MPATAGALTAPGAGSAPANGGWRDIRFSTFDGATLCARDYGVADRHRLPVLCLPGLTRNARDFHDLALDLAETHRVVAFDFRGRGRSAWTGPGTYTPFVEMHDTLALMDAIGLDRAAIVGTSRGGVVAMLLAVARPSAVAACLLNDIGPHVEPAGMLRIAGYVAHSPAPESWDHAVAIVRQINQPAFAGLDDADWQRFARQLYRDTDGSPAADYDPRLADTLKPVSAARGTVPDMWRQFLALRHVPLLVVRGANSDLLSPATVARMNELHPDMQTLTVRDRGHAPFLTEPGVARAIHRLLERAA